MKLMRGQVDFDSFSKVLNRPGGFRDPGEPEEYCRGFQVFDKDLTGFIGVGQLRYSMFREKLFLVNLTNGGWQSSRTWARKCPTTRSTSCSSRSTPALARSTTLVCHLYIWDRIETNKTDLVRTILAN